MVLQQWWRCHCIKVNIDILKEINRDEERITIDIHLAATHKLPRIYDSQRLRGNLIFRHIDLKPGFSATAQIHRQAIEPGRDIGGQVIERTPRKYIVIFHTAEH